MKLIYARYDFPYTYARAATVAGMTPIVLGSAACAIGIVTGSESASALAIVVTIFLMIVGCVLLMIHLLRLRGPDRIGRFLKSARLAVLLLAIDLPFCVAALTLQHHITSRITAVKR